MSPHPSTIVLDTLAAKRLGATEAAEVHAHLEGCERCRADFAQAEAAVSVFTREVLPRSLGHAMFTRRPWWKTLVPVLVPALAAALVILLVVRRPDSPSSVPHDDDIRVKGSSTFQVYARRGDKVHLVRDGESLAPGDAIRFVAGASGTKYVLVVSIDSRGAASVYFPFSGITSALVGDGTHELPGSIVLDATLGPERLFVIFSALPLASGPLLEQLRSIAARDAIRTTTALDVHGATQRTLLFEKVAP